MLYTATFSTKGQLTLPGHVRQLLGIKTGDRVLVTAVEPRKKQVTLEILPPDQNIINELYGSLATATPYIPLKKVRLQAGKMLAKKYAAQTAKRA